MNIRPLLRPRNTSPFIRGLACLALWLAAAHSQAALTARVDRTAIGANESFQLQISSDDAALLDTLPLDRLAALFTIAARSTSQQVNIINGQVQRSATLILTLFPDQSGTLVIPSLEVAGQATQPITIEVGNTTPGSQPQPQHDELAELEISAQGDRFFAQQQILVTQRLALQPDRFSRGNIESLQVNGARVSELGEERFDTVRGNQTWRIIERRYAVFPQRSGPLVIGPVSFNGIIPTGGNSFFSNGRNYRIRSKRLEFEVFPPTYTNAPWLPATNLTAESNLSSSLATQGEAVTRTITLRARNQLGELIPELPLPDVDGLQGYLDGITRDNQVHTHGVDGVATITQVFIPQKEGTFTLPQQQLLWFNTREQKQETLTIPAAQLRATGLASNGQTTPLVPPSNGATTGNIDSIGSNNSASLSHNWLLYALGALLLASLISNVFLWQWLKSSRASASNKIALPDKENEQFDLLTDNRIHNAKDWLAACNHWLATLRAEQVRSAQGLYRLLRTHNAQCPQDMQARLEQWLYQGGQRPTELAQYLQAIRHAYGYPRAYGVYNSRLREL